MGAIVGPLVGLGAHAVPPFGRLAARPSREDPRAAESRSTRVCGRCFQGLLSGRKQSRHGGTVLLRCHSTAQAGERWSPSSTASTTHLGPGRRGEDRGDEPESLVVVAGDQRRQAEQAPRSRVPSCVRTSLLRMGGPGAGTPRGGWGGAARGSPPSATLSSCMPRQMAGGGTGRAPAPPAAGGAPCCVAAAAAGASWVRAGAGRSARARRPPLHKGRGAVVGRATIAALDTTSRQQHRLAAGRGDRVRVRGGQQDGGHRARCPTAPARGRW